MKKKIIFEKCGFKGNVWNFLLKNDENISIESEDMGRDDEAHKEADKIVQIRGAFK